MVELTPEQQLAAALAKIKELETILEKAAQAEAEITRLKESESSLFGTPEKDTSSGPQVIPDNEINKTEEAIMMAMLQEIQKLHNKIDIPGVPDPVAEVEVDSFADSPFTKEIAKIDLPKKFTVSSMRTYGGTSDSQNHVAIFKQKMLTALIPSEFGQVCMCKGFGTTLTGATLQWFINLPNGSIKNFADLVNGFNKQFARSRDIAKRPSNLFRVKQLPEESLKEFLARFFKEKVAIPRCDEETAVEAFTQGVLLDSDIYADLTKKACPTFATVQSITLEHQPKGKDEGPGKRDPRNNKDPPPPPPIYEVKFINGGSEICGLTSSAAKRIARESKLQPPSRSKLLPAVTFDDSDLQGVPDLHHDSLVITMKIGTSKVSRILINGSSSINLVMLDVLKAMKIDEEKIIKKSSVLVEFSGETKNTLGEISLATYVEDVASYERFGQKRRKFGAERNEIINQEVDKLLDMGMIREVMYPDWLANVVVVQKKNGRIQQQSNNQLPEEEAKEKERQMG
ncbi:uncharacterized protein LOC141630452 [Silene latifolia]|uniref:uncharacterized protein LOC141630452 n=1 Tax=Silene latifolia TaxID=37657 RepID=UPI003D781BDE